MTNQDSLSVTSPSSQSHQEDSRHLGSRSRRNKTSGNNISLRNRSHEEDDSGLNSSTEQSESENNLYQFPEESAKEDKSHKMKEHYLLQQHDSESIVNANEHLLKGDMKQAMKEETEKISQVRREEDYSDETKDYEGGDNSNDIPGKDEDGEGYSRELTKVHTNSITLMEETNKEESTQIASKEKRNSSSGASSLSDDEDEVHDNAKVILHEPSQESSAITTQNYQESTQVEVNADESSNKASTQLYKPRRQEEQPLPSNLEEQSQHRFQKHHPKDRKPAQAFHSDKNRKSRKDEDDDYEEDDQVEEPVKMRRKEASLLLRQQESSEKQEERELQEYAEKIRQRRSGRKRCDQEVVQEHHRKKGGDVNQGSVFVSSADEVESVLQVWENEKREFEESSRYRHHQQSSFLFRTGSLSSPLPPPVPPHHQSSSLSSHHASGRVSLLIHPSRIQEENQGEVEEVQQECQFNQAIIQQHHYHPHEEGNQRQSSRSGRLSNMSCTSSPIPPVLPHKHQLNNNQRQDSSTDFSMSSPSLVRRQLESGDQTVPRLVHLDIQEETTTPKITMESSRNEVSLNTNDSTMKKGLLWQMKDGSFFFNRWKERYFILTQDYLTCFKKKTSSSRRKKLGSMTLSSFMGSYSYKLKLLDIEDISWKCCSDCGSSSGSKSSAARRFLLPRSMTMGGKSRDNDVRKLTKRSKSSDPAANVVTQLQQQSVSLSLRGGSSTDIEVIEHNSRSYSTTEGVSLSDAASSRSSSRKRSTFRGNGREVISITMSKGGENKKKESTSQIDLYTDSEPELNEWMFILKEAVDHSKGRREAFIKKSQTLCMPDPSSQPFALASYWATSR